MKLNNLNISDKLVTKYIKHFSKDKTDLGGWEEERKELHNAIFESVNLNRFRGEGRKLSDALDKHCIPFIEKADYFVAGLKKVAIAKNDGEIQQAKIDLQNKQMFEQLELMDYENKAKETYDEFKKELNAQSNENKKEED